MPANSGNPPNIALASGRVRIHEGEKVIRYLAECRSLGTRCALDPRNHSSSVTAVEDCLLLKIEHKVLFEFIAKRIIGSLCLRIGNDSLYQERNIRNSSR